MEIRTSGNRSGWLRAVASAIMDGEAPPSIDRLNLIIPSSVGPTSINDGHVTAAIVFGEDKRKDYQMGQRFIIGEMVALLREQGFVGGDDQALTWLKERDGTWKIPCGDVEHTIFGQRERRQDRERYMLGERNDTGETAGLLATGRHHPFEVDVIGPRGGTERMKLQVHPLALAVPPLTVHEREALRLSISRDGVKLPLELYEKKVLDGRNRLYFASILGKPVQVKEFNGTEEEARRHVAALNVTRRQLTPALQTLTLVRLFGPIADGEVAKAFQDGRLKGNQSRGVPSRRKISETENDDQAGRWENIVAREARDAGYLNVKPFAIRSMRAVLSAPKTIAKIDNREIFNVADSAKSARRERGLSPPIGIIEGARNISVTERLGKIKQHAGQIATMIDMPIGNGLAELEQKFRECHEELDKAEQTMRSRGVIK